MKKLVIASLVILIAGCATTNSRFTRRGVLPKRAQPEATTHPAATAQAAAAEGVAIQPEATTQSAVTEAAEAQAAAAQSATAANAAATDAAAAHTAAAQAAAAQAGNAAAAAQAAAYAAAHAAAQPPASQEQLINITPFSALSTGFTSEPSDALPDAYTRIIVTNIALAPSGPPALENNTPELNYVQRNWLERLFVGEHTSINLTVRLSAGLFTATIPLVSIDHVSNKSDGELFTRIIYHQAENYPIFLVREDGSDDILSVKAAVKISDQVQSGAAGAALQVAENVARAVAPESAVLTTLSAQSAKNVASAIDSAVNKLFSASVDEEQWTDGDVRLWGSGVQITFSIPKDGQRLDKTPEEVGTWTIRLDNPRPSIFSDIQICPPATPNDTRCRADFETAAKAVEAEVAPADILQFRLTGATGSLNTIAAYIRQQDWYTAALKAFSGNPNDNDAVTFCQSIKSSIAALGLNAVDQGLVAYAVVKGMPLPAAGVAKLTDAKGAVACACEYSGCP